MRQNENLLRAIGDLNDELVLAAQLPAQQSELVQEETPKPRPRLRMLRALAIAAALLLAVTVGVGASGVLPGLSNPFVPAFNSEAPAPDPEVLAEMGSPVGVSATDSGITITVESVLRDRYTCTIVTTVKGKGIEHNEVYFDMVETSGALQNLAGSTISQTDTIEGDGAVELTCTWDSEEPLPAGMATVKVDGIDLNRHRFLREKRIEGQWELYFDIGEETMTADLPAGQAFTLEGMDATLDEVTISPLSIMLHYTVDPAGADLNQMDEEGHPLFCRLYDIPFIIVKKDGTMLRSVDDMEVEIDSHLMSGSGNAQEENGRWKCYRLACFDQTVPLDEIVSITVGGVEIPLDGLTE